MLEASAYAEAIGGQTVGTTVMGRIATTVEPYVGRLGLREPMWDFVSYTFARGASGTAELFLANGTASAASTWATIEGPQLLRMGVWVTVHGVP